MGEAEYKGVMTLLKQVREELMEKDKSITAFNVGVMTERIQVKRLITVISI